MFDHLEDKDSGTGGDNEDSFSLNNKDFGGEIFRRDDGRLFIRTGMFQNSSKNYHVSSAQSRRLSNYDVVSVDVHHNFSKEELEYLSTVSKQISRDKT